MGRTDARIEEWKRNLIDLTRRNRLLFFTPTRSSSLRVTDPPIEDVFHRLVVESRAWRFFLPHDSEESPSTITQSELLPSAGTKLRFYVRLKSSSR